MIKKLIPLYIIAALHIPMYCASENLSDQARLSHVDNELRKAIKRNDEEAVRQFITEHPELIRPVHGEYEGCDTLHLHTAVEKSLYNITRLLLEHGTPVNVRENDEATPLHKAAALGDLYMVKLLVSFGADIDRDNWATGERPIHVAAKRGRLATVQYLIDMGADTSQKDGDELSAPLLQAIFNGHALVAQLLARHTLSEDNINDGYDEGLFKAAKYAHPQLVKHFLMHGARTEMTDEETEEECSALDECLKVKSENTTKQAKARAQTVSELLLFGVSLGSSGSAILEKRPLLKREIEQYNRTVFNHLRRWFPRDLQHEILSFCSPIGIGNSEERATEKSVLKKSDKTRTRNTNQEYSGSYGSVLKKQKKQK